MTKKTDYTRYIDQHIGHLLSELRMSEGMSRQQLAQKINVTHQQLRKYERGENSLSAGRLALVAKVFDKKPSYFFTGADDCETTKVIPAVKRIGLEVARNFRKIEDPAHQNAVNILVRTLAKGGKE